MKEKEDDCCCDDAVLVDEVEVVPKPNKSSLNMLLLGAAHKTWLEKEKENESIKTIKTT